MPRTLSGEEFDQLRQRYKVGPQNFDDYFQRKDGAIQFAPRDQLLAAQDEYDQSRKSFRSGQLDAIDLPSMVERAAKDANPNFGLSRTELLARFDDPKYSDTKSSSYIDPYTRLGIADRQAAGYQGVVNEASGRLGELFSKDLLGKQFAVEDSGNQLAGIQAQRQADEDFARQLALKQAGNGGGGGNPLRLSTTQMLQAIAAGVDPSNIGDVANALYGDDTTKNFDDFVKEYQTINRDAFTDLQSQSVDPSIYNELYRRYKEVQNQLSLSPNKAKSFEDIQAQYPDIAPLLRAPSSGFDDIIASILPSINQ